MTEPLWREEGAVLEERTEALVGSLSFDEAVGVLLGDFEPLTSRGLPAPEYVDAGTGLRDVPDATAFPAGIALAASFDAGLAREYGAAVGAEARRAGFTVVLGPTLDLARDPCGGRVPEAFGEDPCLSGLIGAAHVSGLQASHVVAQVKHFAAYTTERRRTGHGPESARGDAVDVVASPATLHDVHLRPFEAAAGAGAWSMMGSYNRLNGEYACQRTDLLGIPRRQWGWRGFYCPDFIHAVRDPGKALAAGLDLGALGGPGGRTEQMVRELGEGRVRELVGNVARAMIGSGLVDDPLPERQQATSPEHHALAVRSAIAGTVLLRNEGLLPLVPSVSIAIIGPSGRDAFFVGGGAASVTIDPARAVTPLAGLRARLGEAADLVVSQGSLGDVPLPVVPAEAFTLPDGSGQGVLVEFTDGEKRWTETLERVDHALDPFRPGERWPLRWRTRLMSQTSGDHRLSLTFGGEARLFLDGEPVLAGAREMEQFISGPHYPMQAVVALEAGVARELTIEFEPGPAIAIPPLGVGPTIRLGWQPPDGLIDDAVAAAGSCDVAVVFATAASGEGMNRDSLVLPSDQNDLIRRVAAVNPRTVVVLNTPGAVEMPWLHDVGAVLQVWYPGEGYGTALAAVLFGDAEPGGRLPLTFPRSRDHLPGAVAPGVSPERLDYDAEGPFGYRSAAVLEHGALFPFGFGLGYARTEATVTSEALPGGGLDLAITVINPGDRDGVHVAQVYAQSVGERAWELVGVRRIPVPAGGESRASFLVGPDQLRRWDDAAQARVPVPGRHLIRVATDAEDPGVEFVLEL